MLFFLAITNVFLLALCDDSGCRGCGGGGTSGSHNPRQYDRGSGDCVCCYEGYVDQCAADSPTLLVKRPWRFSSETDNNYYDGDYGSQEFIFRNDTFVGTCSYCKLFRNNVYATSSNVIIYEDGNYTDICEPNAEGFFCNRCKLGYYRNMGTSCVHCDHIGRDWVLFILSQFPPITIMFLILFLTNFSLVSGPLNASIFFAQIISTTMDLDQEDFPLLNITNSTEIADGLTAVYKFIYAPWNLDFFAPFTYKLCLFKKESFLYYFIAWYAVALYPLILVSIVAFLYYLNNRNVTIVEKCKSCFYCCYRLAPTELHQSSRNVLASFVLLAYMRFSWLSTLLVTPNLLYDYRGDVAKIVLSLDSSISYLGKDHIPIAFVGFLSLFFLIMFPTILLFCRYKNVPKYFSFLESVIEPFQQPFIMDESAVRINQNVAESHRKWRKCWSYIRRSDYQWIPSIYFFLRIFLLVIYLSVVRFLVRFVLQQIVCLLGVLIFIFIAPYPKNWNNKLDAFLFLVLAFINTLSMYQYYLASRAEPLNAYVFALQYILIFIPFVWMTGYITWYFVKHCKCKGDRVHITHTGAYERSGILMTESSSDACKPSTPVKKEYETLQ